MSLNQALQFPQRWPHPTPLVLATGNTISGSRTRLLAKQAFPLVIQSLCVTSGQLDSAPWFPHSVNEDNSLGLFWQMLLWFIPNPTNCPPARFQQERNMTELCKYEGSMHRNPGGWKTHGCQVPLEWCVQKLGHHSPVLAASRKVFPGASSAHVSACHVVPWHLTKALNHRCALFPN